MDWSVIATIAFTSLAALAILYLVFPGKKNRRGDKK